MTKIPGMKAEHAIISDECREGRGDCGAIREALSRMDNAYQQCVKGWRIGTGAKIHIVMTVERPVRAGKAP